MATPLPAPDVTVIIPTFNGEAYLGRILDALAGQSLTVAGRPGTFDVLIIDSGSTDATLDIIAECGGKLGDSKRGSADLHLHQIPNSEFGHGRTRNLAATLARGTYLVYLSHDAVPLGPDFLTEIVAPLATDKTVAAGNVDPGAVVGVVARHIARPWCPPLLKYEITGVFDRCGPRDRVSVERLTEAERRAVASGSPPVDLDARSFYSDVASATRRDFLTTVIPYQDLPYSEDMAFGHDVLVAGYAKAYTPFAVVEHSNDVTFAEYGKRIFDETLGRRRIGQERTTLSWLQAFARAVYGSMRDAPRIVRDPDYSFGARLHWLCINPFWQLRKWFAIRRAITVSLDDAHAIARYSLEAARSRPERARTERSRRSATD